LVYSEKGGVDPIFDVTWSQKEGQQEFVTAGKKHFKWWWPEENKVKKGLYSGNGKPTSHACCTFDDEGTAYSGGANARIYVWKDRMLEKTYKVHNKGMVSAITFSGGKIYSGGKDKQIIVSDPTSGEAERTIQADHLVRAIDVLGDKILCGLKNGSIVEFEGDTPKTLMQGHSMGEAWGLCPMGDDEFATVGDDNMIKVWSISKKECINAGEICNENAKPRKGKASTLSRLAPSKCARAVAFDSNTGNIAVGHNDGRVTIRTSKDSLDDLVATLHDSDEWIETMEYSPCGTYLAVGSHDNNIYLYKVEDTYAHIGTGEAHKSFVVSLDWSADSSFIRSVCGAHELLFFTVADGEIT